MRLYTKLSIGLCAALLLAAGGAGAAEPELNVYSSRHYDVDKKMNEAFTQKTGIKINLVSVTEASQLIERMKAEGKRGPADVLLTVDVGNLQRAVDADLFRKIGSPLVKQKVPASLRDDKDLWTAITFRARVLVYNKEKVKPEELSTYEDLASAKWKGRLLVRTSNHVYNQSLAASLIAAHGDKEVETWAKGVTENLARKPQGGDTDQIKAVAAGVGDVAVVNSYYVARLLASTSEDDKKVMDKVGIFLPNQGDRGTHVNVSGIGIAKHAKNVAQARKYIEFLLSPEIQEMLSQDNKEYPVVPGVAPAVEVKGFGDPKFDKIGLSKIGAKTPAAIKLMDQAGWR
jgi:iron(III) transport system substrate-binding protein